MRLLKIYRATALVAVAAFICAAIYLLSNFVVREVPVSVSYDVVTSPGSTNALFQEIGRVAAALGMKAGKDADASNVQRMHWKKKDDAQGMSWDLMSPGQLHISIYSTAIGSDEDFVRLIVQVQEKISTGSEKITSHLQLAPERFGACASPQRPEVKDSTCIYERAEVLDIPELKALLRSHPSK
ncbi:hypothetical protein [Variovorax sp. Root411]|uniref:hypothetical protein n=1 Tax=Variovorax sp. Root411 TaxID=1736530 RepID=UPI0012F83242|nr:hypothetical protein [Variovorax sp. Root411]